jgi:hypothetical protein
VLPGFNSVDKDSSALQEWKLCETAPLMHEDVEATPVVKLPSPSTKLVYAVTNIFLNK